jgi:hypothetical protein
MTTPLKSQAGQPTPRYPYGITEADLLRIQTDLFVGNPMFQRAVIESWVRNMAEHRQRPERPEDV